MFFKKIYSYRNVLEIICCYKSRVDGVIGNTGLFEKFNVLHLTGVVRLQGLQGYNSRVITPELLGLSTQSYSGLLTRSYRGYRGYNSRYYSGCRNASVYTVWEYKGGVTGFMDVGIQVLQGMCNEAFTPKLHV